VTRLLLDLNQIQKKIWDEHHSFLFYYHLTLSVDQLYVNGLYSD
jgi:hypothetical protein